MDLDVATQLMIEAAFQSFHEQIVGSKAFWFDAEEHLSNIPLYFRYNISIYMRTIAIFETIAFWCWHNAPLQITFDEMSLKDMLQNGRISINWSEF